MPIDIFLKLRKGNLEVRDQNSNKYVVWNKEHLHPDGKKSCEPSYFPITNVWKSTVCGESMLHELNINSTNAFILMFGYSGSGKTYTTLQLLTKLLNQRAVRTSAYQIRGNKIFDVLNSNKSVKYHKTDQLELSGLKCLTLSAEALIKKIRAARHSRKTSINDSSSRTHLIVRLELADQVITIADLAGQENGKTNMYNCKEACKETAYINSSMLALKECIRAVQTKSHVPFRRSVLTMALKEMFQPQTHAAIIGTVNPDHTATHDTLRYISPLLCKPTIDTSISSIIDQYKAQLLHIVHSLRPTLTRKEFTDDLYRNLDLIRVISSAINN